jgi:hypothetical protein
MDLKEFLSTRTREERKAFFKALGKHPNYIHSLAAGALADGKPRKPSAQLARAIEEHSGGLVQKWEALPEVFDPPPGARPARPRSAKVRTQKQTAAAERALPLLPNAVSARSNTARVDSSSGERRARFNVRGRSHI